MLEGKRIAITRDKESASEFIALAREAHAEVIALPTIALKPDPDAITLFKNKIREHYDYLLFMSANAVNMLFSDATILDEVKRLDPKIVAVGPKTKSKIEEYGLKVALMPQKYSSYGVVELFKDSRGSIIIPRSKAANNYLADSLIAIGMKVEEIRFYDAEPVNDDIWKSFIERLARHEIDCIVFTSASSVNAFFSIAERYREIAEVMRMLSATYAVAIGPFTADALSRYGIEADVADEHTISGVFREVASIFKK